MTQREQAKRLIENIFEDGDGTDVERSLKALAEIVDLSQNGGDETIDAALWYRLRDISEHGQRFLCALQTARSLLR